MRLKSILVIVLMVLFPASLSLAQEINQGQRQESICVVYLTGIGCSNCAVIDPILFAETTQDIQKLVIFEIEIFKHRLENTDIKDRYFNAYLPGKRPGVPFLLIDDKNNYIGRYDVLKGIDKVKSLKSNPFPSDNGKQIALEDLDINSIPGKINIWTKNRVLLSDGKREADNNVLKEILLSTDLNETLSKISYKKVKPSPVEISRGKINFSYAVDLGGWILQWNGSPLKAASYFSLNANSLLLIIFLFLLAGFLLLTLSVEKKGPWPLIKLKDEQKKGDWTITFFSLIAIISFFLVAQKISPDQLKAAGYNMPLPLFTLIIGAIDGINPCNIFVLTCLLAILVATSNSRARLYIVAFSFVFVVFTMYFLFMAFWLNVFKYISFINPLRIGIALIAIIAGIINCKELLFFKKGVSLMIPDKQRGPL
ncbi:MAG: hypothetical protein HQL27_02610, partial [Candidatus Omnitrophica bacterium]|nr:hypothetical protein [Candidatus Omnitrophota bacterium]